MNGTAASTRSKARKPVRRREKAPFHVERTTPSPCPPFRLPRATESERKEALRSNDSETILPPYKKSNIRGGRRPAWTAPPAPLRGCVPQPILEEPERPVVCAPGQRKSLHQTTAFSGCGMSRALPLGLQMPAISWLTLGFSGYLPSAGAPEPSAYCSATHPEPQRSAGPSAASATKAPLSVRHRAKDTLDSLGPYELEGEIRRRTQRHSKLTLALWASVNLCATNFSLG